MRKEPWRRMGDNDRMYRFIQLAVNGMAWWGYLIVAAFYTVSTVYLTSYIKKKAKDLAGKARKERTLCAQSEPWGHLALVDADTPPANLSLRRRQSPFLG